MTKEEYMQYVLKLARQAADEDEIPVGAIVVNSTTGEIISEAKNQSAHNGDATSHAEILAIQRACQKLGQSRLWDMDLYVTLEPCPMCAAAISFARIKNLYFGAIDEKGGAVVSGVRFYDSPSCHHKPIVEGGISANESSSLLKTFFQNKRKK